jgi:Na+/phosphate symporter
MNNFENKKDIFFSDEEEKEIEEMEKRKIQESDDFKEEDINYKRKLFNHSEITDEEAEKIIKKMEEEKAEKLEQERKKIQENHRREIEESREDQRDDIDDLYRR